MPTTLPSDASKANSDAGSKQAKQALLVDLAGVIDKFNQLKGALGQLAQIKLASDAGLEILANAAGAPDDLRVKLQAASGLARNATGLAIAAGGVVAAMLADNQVTLAKLAHDAQAGVLAYDGLGAPTAVLANTAGQVFTSNGAGAAPGFQDNPVAFGAQFVSAEQTITFGSILTIAHGLGARPKDIAAFLVCKIAQLGYAVDDLVEIAAWSEAGTPRGVKISADASNIFLAVASAGVNILNKTTGGFAPITPANWKVIGSAVL